MEKPWCQGVDLDSLLKQIRDNGIDASQLIRKPKADSVDHFGVEARVSRTTSDDTADIAVKRLHAYTYSKFVEKKLKKYF